MGQTPFLEEERLFWLYFIWFKNIYLNLFASLSENPVAPLQNWIRVTNLVVSLQECYYSQKRYLIFLWANAIAFWKREKLRCHVLENGPSRNRAPIQFSKVEFAMYIVQTAIMDYSESQGTMMSWILPKNFPRRDIPLPEATDQTRSERISISSCNEQSGIKV